MTEKIVEIQNLAVHRGARKNVLNIENFELRRGELAAIIGPNGAGKSTLLQVINLLLKYQGRLKLFGQDANHRNETMLRRRSAMVFQEALLLKDTVFNNVAMALRFRGVAADEIKHRVYRALEDFHCDHLVDRPARALSGGESQRVSIARALVSEPELLLLDEPFAALDASARGELIEEIRHVAEARGISVLFVSHHFTDVMYFAERVIAMVGGRIVQDTASEELMRRPVNEAVARLVGMDNIIPCRIEHNQGQETLVKLANGISFVLPEKLSKPVSVCCLPGDALQLVNDCHLDPARPWVNIEGIVERVTPARGFYRLNIKVGEHRLRARVPRQFLAGDVVGRSIKLVFDPAEAHLI